MLKGIFFVVGLVLFTAPLSGKFYLSANMPVLGSAEHSSTHHRLLAESHVPGGKTKLARLSLDKRYDLATVFGLPAPVIGTVRYTLKVIHLSTLHPGNPPGGVPATTHLRGPPFLVS